MAAPDPDPDPTAEPTAEPGRPGSLDEAGPATGIPPQLARVLAFLAIVLAGAAGGFIGYAITDLQCEGDCAASKGIAALIGAVIGAGGVAIVAVLALRAMNEWRRTQAAAPRATRVPPRRVPDGGTRGRPRVR